jgi:hypothetical protein
MGLPEDFREEAAASVLSATACWRASGLRPRQTCNAVSLARDLALRGEPDKPTIGERAANSVAMASCDDAY